MKSVCIDIVGEKEKGMMNILVIGLGSMGKRRVRLLKELFGKNILIAGVDQNVERTAKCRVEFQITTYTTLETALEQTKFECAFICTSPLSHSKLIQQCLSHGMNVFSELNLVADGYEENIALAAEKGVKLFLSSTMIYRNEMQYLYHEISCISEPLSYNYHVGQYLPDWHPWENYYDFFVGERKTNGCREILAIELPWLIRVFGPIMDIKVKRTKLTKLQIDYDDCYMILITHHGGNSGMLMVDVVSRASVRSLNVIGEHFFYAWEGTPDSFIKKNIQEKRIEHIDLYNGKCEVGSTNRTINEIQYRNEMRQFFDEMSGSAEPIYGFLEDMETLRVIDKIEKNGD